MARTITDAQAKAIAYRLVDDIETRAQPLIDKGMSREKALFLTIAQMSGRLDIVKG